MHERKDELGNAPIGPLLIRYSTPAMVAMLVSSMYNFVDTIFVGYGAGTLALAGLAIAFPIQMIVVAVGMMVGIGSASVISRNLGAGNHDRAERTAGTSFMTAAAIGVVFSVLGLTFLEPLLRLFGATDAVIPYASDYLSIILLGAVFVAFNVSTNNIIRSEGSVKVAMRSMILGAVMNIILDPIFIFGFDMGIRGAAIATVISNCCVFAYLVSYFLRGGSMLRIRPAQLKPYLPVLPEVFAIGGSSFFRMVAGSLMWIVINNVVIHYGSDIHLAIIGVANRAMMFFFMPIFGIVQGLQPIIGFNYGARNMDRVLEATRKAIIYSTALSTFAFLVLALGANLVLRMFSPDPELISEGAPIMRTLVLAVPFVGFQMVGGALFQAIGKALPAFVLTVARQLLLLTPLLLIMPRYFGIGGVWASFPIADYAALALAAVWVGAELRQLKRSDTAAIVEAEVSAN